MVFTTLAWRMAYHHLLLLKMFEVYLTLLQGHRSPQHYGNHMAPFLFDPEQGRKFQMSVAALANCHDFRSHSSCCHRIIEL